MSSEKTREEYDKIAQGYSNSSKILTSNCILYPTLLKTLGDVSGLDIADLGCGSGHSTRLIAEQKPRRIIGIDISEKMLEIARAEEEKRKQGIEYYQGDVSETDLTQFGKFDLATGCFLLHYSSSREMLENMLDNINSLLKSRGRFVGININPELTPNWQNYQHRYIFPKREEGARLGIELFSSEGIKFAEFTAFYWGRKTYEEAFKKAGFVCSWIPLEVSQEGKEQCGEHYFDAYLANPSCLILELKKIKIKKLD